MKMADDETAFQLIFDYSLMTRIVMNIQSSLFTPYIPPASFNCHGLSFTNKFNREAVCTIFMMVFGMTRPGSELTTYRVRGGHANH